MSRPNWMMTPENKKKIDGRVELISELFKDYRNSLYNSIGGHKSGLVLNVALLREVVERYFEDLEKERIEQHCTLFNGYRQAAFTIKCWMQLRPIQTTTSLRRFLTANEDFALSLAFRFVKVDEATVSESFYKFLAYSLRFSRLDEDLLSALCHQLNPRLPQQTASFSGP
jgi:hypothetical protein